MKLIDEVKKLRDECKKEEEYYNERFNLWMRYKGESWPDLPSDSSACQSVGAIRAKLDRIISEYHPESETQLGYWEPIHPVVYKESKYYKCSECGAVVSHKTAYCPHCGAKMKECDDERV